MPEQSISEPRPGEMHDLDVALGALEGIAAQLEAAQRLREVFLRLNRELVASVRRFPEEMSRRWQHLCQVGMSGRAEEVHAQRETLRQQFENRLAYVKNALRLASACRALLNGEAIGEDDLRDVFGKLEALRDEVLSGWETLEDLEDLLAARFPLPMEKLEALAKKYPPAPAWYEQEGKPF
jgi:hypothetical protein